MLIVETLLNCCSSIFFFSLSTFIIFFFIFYLLQAISLILLKTKPELKKIGTITLIIVFWIKIIDIIQPWFSNYYPDAEPLLFGRLAAFFLTFILIPLIYKVAKS